MISFVYPIFTFCFFNFSIKFVCTVFSYANIKCRTINRGYNLYTGVTCEHLFLDFLKVFLVRLICICNTTSMDGARLILPKYRFYNMKKLKRLLFFCSPITFFNKILFMKMYYNHYLHAIL